MQEALPPALVFLPVLVLWLVVLSLPSFRHLADDKPRKYVTIDGLRGLLAISVFAHHFAITAQWQASAQWELTPSPAWNAMGHAAVTLFFMITGFLFFGKISDPSRKLDFQGFMKGRLLRIYPVYIVSLFCVAVIAWRLQDQSVAPVFALKSIGWWLLFCPEWLFGMDHAGMIVAYTPWSLRYEWCFYLSLPLLARAWGAFRFHPCFMAALCVCALCLTQWPLRFEHAAFRLDTRFIAPFFLGGMALFPARSLRLRQIAQGPIGSAVSLIALLAICVRGEPYSVKCYLAMFLAFVPIAAGASLFGLLKARAMLILGAASYDVYILHGLVLFLLFHLAAPAVLIGASAAVFTGYLALTSGLVIAISLAVHRTIEIPGMAISMRLRSADPRERLAAP